MTQTSLALTVNYQSKSLATSMIKLKNGANDIIAKKDREIEELNSKIADLLQQLNNKNYEIDSQVQNKNNILRELEVEYEQIDTKYETELEVLENTHKLEISNILEQNKKEIKSLQEELKRSREQAEFYTESRKKTSEMIAGNFPSKKGDNKSALEQAARNFHDKRYNQALAEQAELKTKDDSLKNNLKDLLQKQRTVNAENTKKLEQNLNKKQLPNGMDAKPSAKHSHKDNIDDIQRKHDKELENEREKNKKEIDELEKKLASLNDDIEKIQATQNIPIKDKKLKGSQKSYSSLNSQSIQKRPQSLTGLGFVDAEIVRLVNENIWLKNLLDRMDQLAYGKV